MDDDLTLKAREMAAAFYASTGSAKDEALSREIAAGAQDLSHPVRLARFVLEHALTPA